MLTQPLPKTIAFGGVATGNINANEAANVAGTIKYNGSTAAAIAAIPSIGRIIVVVAVLEVNSVKKVTARQMVRTVIHNGQSETPVSLDPIHLSSPLTPKPDARAKPPPKRIKIPHGVFDCTVFQSKANHSVLPFRIRPLVPLTGTTNSNSPMVIAMVESCKNFGFTNRFDQPGSIHSPITMGRLKIHNIAVKQKTVATIFSPRFMEPNP